MTELRRDEGFTLVELLVVIMIIGVLAAISTSVLTGQMQKASRATAVSDMRAVLTAQATRLVDDEVTGYTADVAELEDAGYEQHADIEELVIAVHGRQFMACAKHRTVDDWLVLDSATQAMSWSDGNVCV